MGFPASQRVQDTPVVRLGGENYYGFPKRTYNRLRFPTRVLRFSFPTRVLRFKRFPTRMLRFKKRMIDSPDPTRFMAIRHGVWAVHGSSLSGAFATGGGDTNVKIWAQSASADVVDREGIGEGVIDGTPSGENGQQHQRWECVGGVRGTAGAVGTVLMNEQALTFGTSEALIARFPVQLCMPAR